MLRTNMYHLFSFSVASLNLSTLIRYDLHCNCVTKSDYSGPSINIQYCWIFISWICVSWARSTETKGGKKFLNDRDTNLLFYQSHWDNNVYLWVFPVRCFTLLLTDGINCIVSRFVDSYSSYPDDSTGMISSVLYHLSSSASSTRSSANSVNLNQLYMSGSVSSEQLINFAPLGEYDATSYHNVITQRHPATSSHKVISQGHPTMSSHNVIPQRHLQHPSNVSVYRVYLVYKFYYVNK